MSNRDDLKLQEMISHLTLMHEAINKKVLSSHGLRRVRFFTLEALFLEAGLNLGELCGKILVDRASASRMVFSMEKEGLVRRVPNEEDRRQFTLYLTEEGQALYKTVRADFDRDIEKRFAALDPETKASLLSLTASLNEVLTDHHNQLMSN